MKESPNSSIGFTGLLTILFIGLKLTDKIDWSWWWVLAPMWISFVLASIALVVLVLMSFTK